jgi:hypothetical protein
MPDSDPAAAVGGADPVPRDFATSSIPTPAAIPPTTTAQQSGDSAASPHVHYALRIDPGFSTDTPSGAASGSAMPVLGRSDTEAALSPGIRRRLTRAGTFKTVDDFEDFAVRPGWHRMSTHRNPGS